MASWLFRNVAVLDVDRGGLLPGQDVRVEGALITEIGGGLAPRGATTVEGGGRTLMPGLIDCHVHICSDGMVNTPVLFPAMVVARAAKILRETLLRGFTTIRDAGGADRGYRDAVEAGLFLGPRLFVAGRPISQTGGHGDARSQAEFCPVCALRSEQTMRVIADGVDAVRRAVREEIRRGADQIKVMASGGVASPADPIDYVQYSMDELRALVDEVTRANRYAMAHAYTAPAITRAVEAGVRTIEHGNFLDEATAAQMARAGAYLVPTLIVYRRILLHGKALGVSDLHLEKARQVAEVGTRSLAIAQRAGVKMAFGTDLFRAPKEYQAEEFLVRAEVLPAAEIIRSATVIGAEVVGMAGRLGRVAEGYLADLLLVDGDPLADLGLFQDQGAQLPLIMKAGMMVKNTLSGGGA
jgi:imidazolonepropionase-like amidohydrolase